MTSEQRKLGHVAVKAALKLGLIGKQVCERCGTDEYVSAHHDDYSKPLSIRWLCKWHHLEFHGKAMNVGTLVRKAGISLVSQMTEKAREGNNRRNKRWRAAHPDKYNEYMKEYMRRNRATQARKEPESNLTEH